MRRQQPIGFARALLFVACVSSVPFTSRVVFAAQVTDAASAPSAPAAAPAEVVADVQIHGNNATPDDEVRAIAGVKVGEPFTGETIAVVRQRLVASGKFEDVEVRKRYASIADASQIALVIIVDERAVSVRPAAPGDEGADGPVRIVRRPVLAGAMFLPLLEYEDGYGLAYGVVIAYPNVGGERARLSFPLTWGGRKRAAAEYERPFVRGLVGRVRAGVLRERRTNPAFDEDDDRSKAWGRVESRVAWRMGAGATYAIERVAFAGERETWRSASVDVTLDTRHDPVFPRNAILATASRTHLSGERTGPIDRNHIELQGFVGVVGSPVVVIRMEQDTADRALPPYFKPLLGGWASVRGFAAGSFAGDNRLVTSIELRVPVSSPLSAARTGFSVFADRGTVYDAGVRAGDAPWRTGYGAGVWLSAAFVRMGVSVAHAQGRDTRVTVGIGVGK